MQIRMCAASLASFHAHAGSFGLLPLQHSNIATFQHFNTASLQHCNILTLRCFNFFFFFFVAIRAFHRAFYRKYAKRKGRNRDTFLNVVVVTFRGDLFFTPRMLLVRGAQVHVCARVLARWYVSVCGRKLICV